jgi:CRISPR-associated protein Csx17
VRGAFVSDGFRLSGIAASEVVALLVDDWVPTPVLTPWNNASGFYDSAKGRLAAAAIEAVLGSSEPRLEPLRRNIEQVRRLVHELGFTDAPEKEAKAAFVKQLRGVLSDDAIAWIDAVAAVDDGQARFMPMLGSGGNEGVLDYSGLFLRSLVETLLGDRARSIRLLESVLFGKACSDLLERPGGQFEPGTAGGFNTGPGFESKGLPNNPWSFLLLVEGTILWASGIASRQRGIESGYRLAVSPFTVRHRAAGYGSAADKDDDPQRVRAELWVPVWHRPSEAREVAKLISEGRADVRSARGAVRHATESLDFVDAVGALGVDRGVTSFVRYALAKRRGDAFIALPAGQVEVNQRREVDLLRQLDGEMDAVDAFLSRFPSEQGAPALLTRMRRAIDDARFNVAARGGHDAMLRLARAIGALEMTLARRDPGKEPQLRRPLGGLSPEWVEACGDSTEVRIAAALASIRPTGGARSIRTYLAPIDPDDPGRFAPAARALPFAGRDLADRLASVLQRRLLDVRSTSQDGVGRSGAPTRGSRTVRLDEIGAFLVPGLVDDHAVEELLFAFTWLAPRADPSPAPARPVVGATPPLPRSYSLLKLLFLPDGLTVGGERVDVLPDASIVPLLHAGRVADAVEIARRQLRALGLRPRRVVDQDDDDPAFGRRLAAALLIPIGPTPRLANDALLPATDETTETPDAR